MLEMFFANLILLLLFNKSPDDKDVVAATVVAIIIRADSMMARSGIADNKFNAPFFHYQAPPSTSIRSVRNPAHNPTKIPAIRILFVVCLLPELYIKSETYINAPPARDKNRIYAIEEFQRLPNRVPINVGPPPINPANIKKRILGFFTRPVKGPAIPNPSVAL